MKFSKGEYTITKDYAMSLNNKVERFIESTKKQENDSPNDDHDKWRDGKIEIRLFAYYLFHIRIIL